MQTTVPRGRTYCGYRQYVCLVRVKWVVGGEDAGVVREGTKTNLSSLLEWLLIDSDEDDGVWSKTVLSRGLHVLDDVLAGGEVDERAGTKLFHAHLLLLLTGVNGDDPQTHGLGVLLGEGSESTTGTDNGDGLAWASTGFL